MLAHGAARARRVVGRDRLKDTGMGGHHALEKPALVRDQRPHGAHHIVNGIEQENQQRVMRGFAEAAVKFRIFAGEQCGIAGGGLHLRANARQFAQIVFGRLLRRERRILHFENRPDLVKMLDADIFAADAKEQGEGIHHLLTADGPYGCTDAVTGFEKSARDQIANRFANDGPANAELFGEFPFGREAGADGKASADDLSLDGLDHAVDEAVFASDGLEAGFRPPFIVCRDDGIHESRL